MYSVVRETAEVPVPLIGSVSMFPVSLLALPTHHLQHNQTTNNKHSITFNHTMTLCVASYSSS